MVVIKRTRTQRGEDVNYVKLAPWKLPPADFTSTEEGFDFLGFNHRQYNGKLLIRPSSKKVLDFCKRIGTEVKAMNGVEQEVVIKKLNPVPRGFANYYKGVVSTKTFSYISHRIWESLGRWAKRRHPNKNTKWVRKRYFKTGATSI